MMIVSDLEKTTTKPSIASIPNLPAPVEQPSPDVTPEEFATTLPSSTENTSFVVAPINKRKRQIMEHIKKSNGNYHYFSEAHQKRNKKIREHIKSSLA